VPSKIQAQAGVSLADVYNVKGSIAGVESLLSEDVQVVHEMGSTLFSERLSGTIRRADSGPIGQSTTFDVILTDLPPVPTRVLGIQVISDDGSRLTSVSVMARDGGAQQEFPLFVWSAAVLAPDFISVRMQDDGAAAAAFDVLAPQQSMNRLPTLLLGSSQPQVTSQISMRGTTSAFGAGTVATIALIYITFAEQGGLSSHGLPVPGW